jgi:hypothetical protein
MLSRGKFIEGVFALIVLIILLAGCSKTGVIMPITPQCGLDPRLHYTPTATSTPTLKATCTFTFTATATATSTCRATSTFTFTATPTYTSTATLTATSTSTGTPTPVPVQTCAGITASRTHYNSFDDFSFAANPVSDGAWRYGYTDTLGGTLNLYTAKRTCLRVEWSTTLRICMWVMDPTLDEPGVFKNGTGIDIYEGYGHRAYFPPKIYLYMHPGPQNQYSVVRWTCPADGIYRVDSAFRSMFVEGTIATTDTHVLHNNVPVYNGLINNFYSDGEFPYAATLTMKACDIIDFAVGYGSNGNYYCDGTGMRATIDYDSALP